MERKDLFYGFTEGTLSQGEKGQFNALIAEDESFRGLACAWIALKEYLNNQESTLSDNEVEEGYKKLAVRLGLDSSSSHKPSVLFWSVTVAAIVAIVFMTMSVMRQNPSSNSGSHPMSVLIHDSSHAQPVRVISFNSAWDSLRVKLFVINPITVEVNIHSLTGEIVRSFPEKFIEGDTTISIFWRPLPSGTYRLRVSSADTLMSVFKPEGPLFVRTADSTDEDDDQAATVTALFGPDYASADFKFDLKQYCTDLKREKELIKMVDWKHMESVWVKDSGHLIDTKRGLANGRHRHFLATRSNDGMIHFGYELNDTLPNGWIVEGSYFGRFPTLAVRRNWMSH